MSLRVRSLIALGLLFGFYALGALVVLGLLAVPWAQLEYEHNPNLVGILCAVAGLWVAWAMVPRWRRSSPSEGELDPVELPGLFELVGDLARRTGQRPPAKLYLLPEVNAFAGTESRWFGLRRVPIVGVGLPLLTFLSRDELSSVIAHEFGHHQAGDTRLGPLLYHTRSAIGRAIDHLDGSRFLLHLPFTAYARLFLRVTRGIGRAQELNADALASQVVGALASATAAEKVERLAPAWDAYWHGEYLPVLAKGVAPPLFDGFHEFLDRPELRPKLRELYEQRRNRPPSPYDTHPPLGERLRHFGFAELPEPAVADSLDLLKDAAHAEETALRLVLVPGAEIRRLSWSQAGEEVWVPAWREELASHGDALASWRASELATVLAASTDWFHRLRNGPNILSRRAQRLWLQGFATRWLAIALHERGFKMSALPGAPVLLHRDDAALTVDPDAEVTALAEGKVAPAAWAERCQTWGLT